MKNPLKNILNILRTYDFKKAIPNIRTYGLRTFLNNARREMSRSSLPTEKAQEKKAAKLQAGKSVVPEENMWADYQTLSERIRKAEANRIQKIKVEPIGMIAIDKRDLETCAASLTLPLAQSPLVSIIIPVFNNIKFTLECLSSIEERTKDVKYEVVVVDDCSADQTGTLVPAIRNIRYFRNSENLGFVRTCNEGAGKARGKYLLFLNNDVQVKENWLTELIKTFSDFSNVGAVGPKVLYPNGRLQEAGALINRDCSTGLIGLNDEPALPRYNYEKEVDYCSGVCLVVEAETFRSLGGFDTDFAPAYCEDVDLCLALRNRGLRIIYNPKAVIMHHLSATSDKLGNTYKIQQVTRNQQKLAEKWQAKIDGLNDVRLVSFYLPQFHPIPENDLWWGKGFTEWRNVGKARPNFVGHYQPRIPADLGYYDLRLPEVMDAQAELAKRYGLYGFCYYYYWFAGKRLLEMPLERLLMTNKPDIPFCLCWANETWSRRWNGQEQDVLMGQSHSDEDDRAAMRDLMRYMRHPQYICINGKPVLLIYRINLFPDIKRTTEIWREVCLKEGIGEIYLAMVESFEHALSGEHPSQLGFDASVEFPPHGINAPVGTPGKLLNPEFRGFVNDYREVVLQYIMDRSIPAHRRFRSVMTAWDNTPRRQNDSYIFHYATPGAYQAWLEAIIEQTREQNFGDERIVFINAWNEWAEGAYLEPDQRFGHGYLQATRNALERWLCEGNV